MNDEEGKEPEGEPGHPYFYEWFLVTSDGSRLCRFMHAHDQAVPLIGECWTERCLDHEDPRVEPFLIRPFEPFDKAPC